LQPPLPPFHLHLRRVPQIIRLLPHLTHLLIGPLLTPPEAVRFDELDELRPELIDRGEIVRNVNDCFWGSAFEAGGDKYLV
jgi:hypothetical protein